MRNIIVLFLILFFNYGFAEKKSPSAIVIKSQNGEIVTAFPLSSETVLKFEGDSLKVSLDEWSSSISKESFDVVDHDNINSPLSMTLTLDNRPDVPIPDACVVLSGENLESDCVINHSKENGDVIFPDIPIGVYKVKIQPKDVCFHPREVERLWHCYKSNHSVTLFENVLLPKEVSFEVINDESGICCIALNWLMDPQNPDPSPFKGYVFTIYLNEEYVGETSDTHFTIKDVMPGVHEVRISSLSSYGNLSDGYVELIIEVEDGGSDSVSVIGSDDSSEESYYDINGLKVPKEYLSPGLYIRRNSNSVTKIIIP